MRFASPWALPVTLVAGLCVIAPARADWIQYGGNPEHGLTAADKITAPLAVLWKHDTHVYADKTGNPGGPVIDQGTVYFPSKNRVYAVDAATGEFKWRSPEGDPNDASIPRISATPVANGDFLYVPDSSGRVTAYSTINGSQIWVFATKEQIRSSPTLVGNDLYFGSDDNSVYHIDAKTGELKGKSNDGHNDLKLTDSPIGSATVSGGVVYINSSDMKLWAFDANTMRMLWSQRITNASNGISPVVYNGRVYLAAGSTMYQFRLRGGSFRAYTLRSPTPQQQWLETDISTTPIITDQYWFVGDRDGYFHAFLPSGKPAANEKGDQWKVKLDGHPQGTPVLTADTLYVTTDKGFVYGIDPVKGKITWTYRCQAPSGITPYYLYYAVRAPMAVSDGRLYVLGDDGTLTCLSADAPDYEGPTIIAPRPSRGSVINGAPPLYLAAYLWDEGSGINPETIELLLDGGPIDPDPASYESHTSGVRKGWVYDPIHRLLSFTTPKAEKGEKEQILLDGPHKVQVYAADWHGNVNSLEWSFVVDSTLPRGAIATKPKTPSKAGQTGQPGQPGQPGGYPGMGAYGGMGGPQGQQNGQNGQFRNRLGGYTYQNRGQNGYGYGNGGGNSFGGGGGGGRGGYGR